MIDIYGGNGRDIDTSFASHATIALHDGTVGHVVASQDSTFTMHNGHIQRGLEVGTRALVTIYEGQIDEGIVGEATLRLLGGAVNGGLNPGSVADWHVEGGEFDDLVAVSNATVTIVGSDFNYPYGPLPTSGTLTGTLANGDAVNATFARASTATITLPEPGAEGLVGGLLLLVGLARRRRQPARG